MRAFSGRRSVVGRGAHLSQAATAPCDLADLSDEAVVALVARAEESALAELYDRFGGPAYTVARRILRDSTLAEDAVQEAFLAIWRGAGRFVPERARAASWIMTIVHRRAVDLVRREQRRRSYGVPERLDDTDDLPAYGVEASALEAVSLRLERERVQAALARLSDQQRETLELAYYGGFTQVELAERLGRPLGTIKSQMYAALANLRDLLAEPSTEEGSWREK